MPFILLQITHPHRELPAPFPRPHNSFNSIFSKVPCLGPYRSDLPSPGCHCSEFPHPPRFCLSSLRKAARSVLSNSRNPSRFSSFKESQRRRRGPLSPKISQRTNDNQIRRRQYWSEGEKAGLSVPASNRQVQTASQQELVVTSPDRTFRCIVTWRIETGLGSRKSIWHTRTRPVRKILSLLV